MSNHKSLEYFIILGFSRETVPLGDIYGGREGGIDWFYCNEWAHIVTEVDKSNMCIWQAEDPGEPGL